MVPPQDGPNNNHLSILSMSCNQKYIIFLLGGRNLSLGEKQASIRLGRGSRHPFTSASHGLSTNRHDGWDVKSYSGSARLSLAPTTFRKNDPHSKTSIPFPLLQ